MDSNDNGSTHVVQTSQLGFLTLSWQSMWTTFKNGHVQIETQKMIRNLDWRSKESVSTLQMHQCSQTQTFSVPY